MQRSSTEIHIHSITIMVRRLLLSFIKTHI